jgi:hypothetical protein
MASKNAVAGLSQFEGRDVLQATIKVTNAGDGLSDALGIEPCEYHLGETVYLVIEAEVSRVNYEEIKDTGALKRVHTFRAGDATMVDGQLVAKVLEDQRIALEKAKGVERLPLEEDD